MTTLYPSKEVAIKMGIFYCRGVVDIPIDSLKFTKETIRHPLDDEGRFDIVGEKYRIENNEGKEVEIIVTPCDGGFHLWMCVDGACIRA